MFSMLYERFKGQVHRHLQLNYSIRISWFDVSESLYLEVRTTVAVGLQKEKNKETLSTKMILCSKLSLFYFYYSLYLSHSKKVDLLTFYVKNIHYTYIRRLLPI